MEGLSDNSLMLKVKSGDLDKLGLLYERYKHRLFGFFYQMNKDASLSEDLVQTVFMRIIKYKHTYTGESKFISWIFNIARNVNYDSYKSRTKNGHAVQLKEIEDRLNSPDNVFESMVNRENENLLDLALAKLSQDKKEVLVLSKLKEIQFKEVGLILGCTEGAARTKAHRALKELKTIFLALENRHYE